MTFANVSEAFRLDLTSSRELDERQNSESPLQFTKRVKNFLTFISSQTGTVYLCSHLDWIEEALREIPGDTDLLQDKYQHWAPGQFMTFEVTSQLWHLGKFGSIEP